MRVTWWLPLAVLLGSLAVSFQLWQNELHEADTKHKTDFVYQASEATSLVSQQLLIYKQALIGVQSFYQASTLVERDEFHDYVNKFLIAEKSSPVQAVGYAQYVQKEDKKSFISAVQQDIPSYNIYPESFQDSHAPITYIEPDSVINQEKLGFDAFTDVVRKAAMDKARDSDDISVILLHKLFETADPDKQMGFVMLLPIYKNGKPHVSLTERRENLLGWVFMRISLHELIETSLGKLNQSLSLTIYDAENAEDVDVAHKIFASSSAKFMLNKPLDFLNHRWIYHVESSPQFDHQKEQYKPNLVGLAGIFASLMLTFLVILVLYGQRSLRSIRRINNRLVESEQRWKFALEGAGDGVWDWDIQNNLVTYSRRWKEMLGYSEDEISNEFNEWQLRIHPEDLNRVMANIQSYSRGEIDEYVNELRMQCKDGQWKWILSRGMIVSRDEAGNPLRMVGTHTDISKIKESEEVIWQHANFDSLTGLPNRRMFYDRLELEIRKTGRTHLKMALLFLDLDRFKEVNDTLGHSQGDALLVEASRRLGATVRATDTVARLGGDEFIIILGDLDDIKTAERIAQDILLKLQLPFNLGDEIAYVSSSIGITLYPDDALTMDDLMKNVDQAMYAAKHAGGARYSYFTPSMQQQAQQRMALANDLRGALESNQFSVVYQPIIDFKDGSIYKAEALLRWHHPVRGNIPPMVFIPVAEDIGLIIEIGDWVFHEVIKQVSVWREKLHPDFQISINKSPVQFRAEPNAEHSWYRELKAAGLSGSSLTVEITEGILLEANDSVTKCLMEFRDAGIQVAIDDFGTGYSSLSYIKKFDIDYIKIDKSFVSNLTEGSDDLGLCEAIIVMAHKLGLKVIAEGVETELQRDLLMAAGCDFAQGYLFSKPVDAEAFEKLFN